MCLYPRLKLNKKYVANKKNGGNVPPMPLKSDGTIDKRVAYVPIGCGNCMECRKQKSREWQVRLNEEIKHSKNGVFVTLTFSDQAIAHYNSGIPKKVKGYTKDNEIATRAVRDFLERWRAKFGTSVKHWLVTELGHKGTQNIHLHGIIWTDNPGAIRERWNSGRHGANGFVWLSTENKGFVNERTVNYIIKYVSKTDDKNPKFKGKVLVSPGIGNQFTKTKQFKKLKYNKKGTKEYYKTPSGLKVALPIYYRNKLYTEKERELLWLEKLDKKVRYINGIKIDISKGMEQYEKVLKHNQFLNRNFKFGELYEWDEIRYANELRNLKIEERVKRAYARGQKKVNN